MRCVAARRRKVSPVEVLQLRGEMFHQCATVLKGEGKGILTSVSQEIPQGNIHSMGYTGDLDVESEAITVVLLQSSRKESGGWCLLG